MKQHRSSIKSLTRNRNNVDSDQKYIPNSQTSNNVHDLSQLLHFDTENILNNMKHRFCNKSTNSHFTSIKQLNVLLSINPYTKSPNNSHNKMIQQFNDSSSTTAAKIFKTLLESKINQSIIICGDTGSGKTETTKSFIKYLALSKVTESPIISQQIIASSVMLESFGNAYTIQNSNSSCFGSCCKFLYSMNNNDTNTCIKTLGINYYIYLFDDTRIHNYYQKKNQGNFQIFYMLNCAPKTLIDKEKYCLIETMDKYHYLNQNESVNINQNMKENYQNKFSDLIAAFSAYGIDIDPILKLVSGVLNLGNINFKKEGDGFASIDKKTVIYLNAVSSVFAIDVKRLEERLLTATMMVMKKRIVKKIPYEEYYSFWGGSVFYNRDNIARGIYKKIFEFIVELINKTFSTESNDENSHFINILDSIGFINFYMNSLHEFCINYTNEKLQQFFYGYISNKTQCLFWKSQFYKQDQQYFELMDHKKLGFFLLLDSACKAPKPDGEAFQQELFKRHSNNGICKKITRAGSGDCIDCPIRKKKKKGKNRNKFEGLLINHFNDDVTYNASTESLLAQNMKGMHPDTKKMLMKSTNNFIRDEFSGLLRRKKKKKSITNVFLTGFKNLLESMKKTEPTFIFCINSNYDKTTSLWNDDIVKKQLKSYGIIQAVKVLKFAGLFICGYANTAKNRLLIPNDIVQLIAAFCEPVV
eukprot:195094_1